MWITFDLWWRDSRLVFLGAAGTLAKSRSVTPGPTTSSSLSTIAWSSSRHCLSCCRCCCRSGCCSCRSIQKAKSFRAVSPVVAYGFKLELIDKYGYYMQLSTYLPPAIWFPLLSTLVEHQCFPLGSNSVVQRVNVLPAIVNGNWQGFLWPDPASVTEHPNPSVIKYAETTTDNNSNLVRMLAMSNLNWLWISTLDLRWLSMVCLIIFLLRLFGASTATWKRCVFFYKYIVERWAPKNTVASG